MSDDEDNDERYDDCEPTAPQPLTTTRLRTPTDSHRRYVGDLKPARPLNCGCRVQSYNNSLNSSNCHHHHHHHRQRQQPTNDETAVEQLNRSIQTLSAEVEVSLIFSCELAPKKNSLDSISYQRTSNSPANNSARAPPPPAPRQP